MTYENTDIPRRNPYGNPQGAQLRADPELRRIEAQGFGSGNAAGLLLVVLLILGLLVGIGVFAGGGSSLETTPAITPAESTPPAVPAE